MIRVSFSDVVYQSLRPKVKVPTRDWVAANLKLSNESKVVGRVRLDLAPHMLDLFDAFDDPRIEIITAQWAAQLGKTLFAQACLAKHVVTDGRPSAWADADEKSVERVINRTWRTFAVCDALDEIMPKAWEQSSHRMEFKNTIVHGAWPRSSSSAADYGAALIILNETDKMNQASTSKESDFRYLMRDRTKGYRGFKILQLSTPTLKGESFIEGERFAGDNRRRMVPCPHCNHFQELQIGNGTDPGGLRFDKTASGKLSPEKAFDTARYQCEKCERKIEEHHRPKLCNEGKWVPEGCEIKKSGKIVGEPTRPGRHASFGPLSTLHSLLPGISFASIAQTFVEAITSKEHRSERIRNVVNSWEGKTFDPAPVQVTHDDIVDRMAVDEPLRVCPTWSRFLTLGADVGAIGNILCFHWWVSAWGPMGRGQMVDAGTCWSEDDLFLMTRNLSYPHADEGPPLRLRRSGIDSGSFTNQIYKLVARLGSRPDFWPLKGASADTFLEMYKGAIQRTDLHPAQVSARLRRKDYDLILVNTERSQSWVEDRITGVVTKEDPDWYSIPREAFEGALVDTDLVHHLTGDHKVGNRWEKRWEDQHLRDGLRYSKTMAWHYTTNGTTWNKLSPREATRPRPAPISVQQTEGSPFVRRSGVPFVASQR